MAHRLLEPLRFQRDQHTWALQLGRDLASWTVANIGVLANERQTIASREMTVQSRQVQDQKAQDINRLLTGHNVPGFLPAQVSTNEETQQWTTDLLSKVRRTTSSTDACFVLIGNIAEFLHLADQCERLEMSRETYGNLMDVAKRRVAYIPELFDTGVLARWDQEALWNCLVDTKGDHNLVYSTLTPPTTEPTGIDRARKQDRPLRLLSLDGGGVRGLSSIMILQHIMAGMNSGRAEDDQLQPYQVFDLIGGTSTGGIIGIMLGRLKMTLAECEEAYLLLSERIFQPKRSWFNKPGRALDFLGGNGKFDAAVLETAIKEIIADRKESKDMLFKDPNSGCKVFVCAARANNVEPALLRTYKNPKKVDVLYDECKVWEACRATSAATTFFDPFTFGKYGQTFVDGAIIYNNPIQLVHREAENIWPGRESLLISIGTGSAPNKPFKGNIKRIVDSMKAILTQTERTADDFYQSHPGMVSKELLFRFNVLQGLEDVGLEEYEAIAAIADATHSYVDKGETESKQSVANSSLMAPLLRNLQIVDREDVVATKHDLLSVQGMHHEAAIFGVGRITRIPMTSRSSDTSSALHWAVERGKIDLVRDLIHKGAAIDYANPGVDIDCPNASGDTPLMTAVRFKRTAIAEYLIQKEADVEAESHKHNGLRPLHVAAEEGDAEGIFLLVKYHAQIEARSGLGLTPLMHAAWKDNAAALRALLESNALIEAGLKKGGRTAAIPGVDIEKWVNERSTALILAAQSGNIAVVKLLVERHADLEARTNNGETPLIAASIYGHVRVVQYLLEKGSNAEARTRGTFTALLFAANRDHPEVARTLLDFGALVDSKKSHGMTALMEAIYMQRLSTTQLLVEKGASLVETADSILGMMRPTPLHIAARRGNTYIIQLLVGRGADIQAKTANGFSSLDIARSARQNSAVELLLHLAEARNTDVIA
ncbi:hypothetical protein D6C81_08388 [Aureobasidium pullulans]|nr:hypothetical protein D6C81_08388 [Aureobasidium pullulans]